MTCNISPFLLIAQWVRNKRNYDSSICLAHILEFTIKMTDFDFDVSFFYDFGILLPHIVNILLGVGCERGESKGTWSFSFCKFFISSPKTYIFFLFLLHCFYVILQNIFNRFLRGSDMNEVT